MWSTAGQVPAVGQVDINHFVPLVKMQSAGCVVPPAVVQVDDTDELHEQDAHDITAGLAMAVIY